MWQCHTLLRTRPLSVPLRLRLLAETRQTSAGLCRICCSATQVPQASAWAAMTKDTAARNMPKVSI